MTSRILPVDLSKSYRLLNHGPTVLVSARHDDVENVMAAAWACVLDYAPVPKLTVVIDKATATRVLIEQSGMFGIQVPTVAQVQLTNDVGTWSLKDEPDKLERAGVKLFTMPDYPEVPFVEGCAAWLVCKLIPEPHNQNTYDLFIGEIVAAWADVRVFQKGHWLFEEAGPQWRSIHHVAGGHFYAIGEALKAEDKAE